MGVHVRVRVDVRVRVMVGVHDVCVLGWAFMYVC